jgi:glycosyltransferase involved in cell wall biosynthesis
VVRGEIPAIVDALSRLHSDAELRTAQAAAARQLARDQFDIERTIDKLEDLYLRAASRRGAHRGSRS